MNNTMREKILNIRNTKIYMFLVAICIAVSFFLFYYLFSKSVYFKMNLELSIIISICFPIIFSVAGFWWNKFVSIYSVKEHTLLAIELIIYIFVFKYIINYFGAWDLSFFGVPFGYPNFGFYYLLFKFVGRLSSCMLLVIIGLCFWCGMKIYEGENQEQVQHNYENNNRNKQFQISLCFIAFLFATAFIPYTVIDLTNLSDSKVSLSTITEQKNENEDTIDFDVATIPDDEFDTHKDPSSVQVIIKKIGSTSAYIELYKNKNDNPIFAKQVTEDSEATLYVKESLKIVTSKPDAFEVYAGGRKLEFTDENNAGVYTCYIEYEDYSKEWIKKNNEIVLRQ